MFVLLVSHLALCFVASRDLDTLSLPVPFRFATVGSPITVTCTYYIWLHLRLFALSKKLLGYFLLLLVSVLWSALPGLGS